MGASSISEVLGQFLRGTMAADSAAEQTRVKRMFGLIFEMSAKKETVDAMAADTSEIWVARLSGVKVQLQDTVKLLPQAALTAHDTNYATISLEVDDGAAGSNTVLASQTTKITGGSGDWVAGTAEAVTITATKANRVIDATSADKFLILKIAKAASGVAVQPFVLAFAFEHVA